MVFESAASGGHDTQVFWLGAIESQLIVFEVSHELDTIIDTIGLEGMEVKPSTGLGRMRLTREVDELGQRTTNLSVPCQSSGPPCVMRQVSSVQGQGQRERGRGATLTSTAMWLTTAVWLGSLMSLPSW